MFTGIVQTVGRIAAVSPHGDGVRIAVDTGVNVPGDVAIGDSVAVRGCCLTVVAKEGATLTFDVSAETLRCATGLDTPGDVNLELALRMGDRLGGHLMTGHVDGVGIVTEVTPEGDSTRIVIEAPAALAPYIAAKGSVALDGISLTVNEVSDQSDGAVRFGLNVIPHTQQMTTWGEVAPGRQINIEIDVLARYLGRMEQLRRVV